MKAKYISYQETHAFSKLVLDYVNDNSFLKPFYSFRPDLVGLKQAFEARNFQGNRKEGDFFIGRTEFDSPEVDNEVLIDANSGYAANGSFVQVKIDRAEDFDLYGQIVK